MTWAAPLRTGATTRPTDPSDPAGGAGAGPGGPLPAVRARLRSIDALRGFNVLWVIGGDDTVHALSDAVGHRPFTDAALQMQHAGWNGFRFYDLIFPLFVFIAGLVVPFSVGRQEAAGASRGRILAHAVRRCSLLVLLGIVYNNGLFRLGLGQMRYPSVLGRIGVTTLAATLIVVLGRRTRTQVLWLVGLLVGYWALLALVPVPGIGPGHLGVAEDTLPGYVDRLLLPGQLLYGPFDPEGILSTLPAVGTALAGALCGRYLLQTTRPGPLRSSASAASSVPSSSVPWSSVPASSVPASPRFIEDGDGDGDRDDRGAARVPASVCWLAGAGVAALAAGWTWGLVLPVNKNLWTSSYVLVAAGFSLLLVAGFHYLIDVRGWDRWAFVFTVIGANSVLAYTMGHVIDFQATGDFFVGGLLGHLPEAWRVVGQWAAYVAVEWLLLWQLYRRRIFVRL